MLRAYAATDIGKKRRTNQDYAFASREPVGPLPNLYMVADGMGGHNAGDFASRCAVETVVESLSGAVGEPISALRTAIADANAVVNVIGNRQEEMRGMGTTLVAAVYLEGKLHVANVGDSRLYVIGDTIRQVTRDHSLVEEMIRMGGLDPEKAKDHPDKHVITRAIGIRATVKADFFSEDLADGEKVLLCSDGLSNMLSDSEIYKIVKEAADPEEGARALIQAANQNGGEDNIAVVLITP